MCCFRCGFFHVCAAAVAVFGASFAACADLVGAFFLFCWLMLFVLLFVQLASACAAFVACPAFAAFAAAAAAAAAFGSPTVEKTHPCRF